MKHQIYSASYHVFVHHFLNNYMSMFLMGIWPIGKVVLNLFSSLCRFSQGLRLRQTDLIEDGVAGSSRTLTNMASSLRKV